MLFVIGNSLVLKSKQGMSESARNEDGKSLLIF